MKKLHLPYIQISQAAFHIYAAEGPKGMTMRKVGAAVGVRASALYRHFRNKDALMDAVAAVADQAVAERLRAPKRQKPHRNRLRKLVGRALDLAIEQPRMLQLTSTHRPKWREPSRLAPAAVLRELEQAAETGQVRRGDQRQHAASIWAQICGLAAIHGRGDLPPERRALNDAWFAAAQPTLDGLWPQRAAA